jgi:hypothetical protein
VLGNGPRQAIGLRTWIQKCKYELDLSDVVRCATHFASGKISTDADKDRKVEPNQPGELEAVRTHERIAPLTRSSPCEDYRIKGRDRLKTMTLDAAEFIRRFLLHVLPSGFHRIRHYGLFAGTVRARNIERVRQALAAPERSPAETDCDFEDPNTEGPSPGRRCPCCGGRMIIVETFDGARPACSPSPTRIRIDTS